MFPLLYVLKLLFRLLYAPCARVPSSRRSFFASCSISSILVLCQLFHLLHARPVSAVPSPTSWVKMAPVPPPLYLSFTSFFVSSILVLCHLFHLPHPGILSVIHSPQSGSCAIFSTFLLLAFCQLYHLPYAASWSCAGCSIFLWGLLDISTYRYIYK